MIQNGNYPQTPANRRSLVSLKDVYKIYRQGEVEVRALNGVNVDIYSGQFTAIVGPSGSGKSTLLHCLAGLDAVKMCIRDRLVSLSLGISIWQHPQ